MTTQTIRATITDDARAHLADAQAYLSEKLLELAESHARRAGSVSADGSAEIREEDVDAAFAEVAPACLDGFDGAVGIGEGE